MTPRTTGRGERREFMGIMRAERPCMWWPLVAKAVSDTYLIPDGKAGMLE